MLQLIRTTFHFPSLIKSWTSNWPWVLLFLGRLLEVQLDSHSSGGSCLHIHLGPLLIPECLSVYAMLRNDSILYVESVFRHGRTVLRNFHVWLLLELVLMKTFVKHFIWSSNTRRIKSSSWSRLPKESWYDVFCNYEIACQKPWYTHTYHWPLVDL